MRVVACIAASCVALSPALAPALAEEAVVNVAGGEHQKFSRVVLDVDGAAYELRPGRRKVTVLLPTVSADIALDRFNASRSAHRVIKAQRIDAGAGARIDFDLTCDCGVKVAYGRSGRLILDISESYPKNAAAGIGDGGALKPKVAAAPKSDESPTAKPAKPASAISAGDDLDEARASMLAMLARAADEGIVQFRNDVSDKKDERDKSTAPARAKSEEAEKRKTPGPKSRRALAARAASCRDDDWFFPIGDVDLDRPFDSIGKLQGELVGEFDAANHEAVRRLFWTYAAIGFGDEARALLTAFPQPGADQAAMLDVAQLIADRPIDLSASGVSLMGPGDCRGFHGLFQATALAEDDPERAIELAFAARSSMDKLPGELVREFAPRLGLAAVEAGDWTLAGHFNRVAALAGADGPTFHFLSARFDKYRGREDKARAKLKTLAREESERQADALFELAEEYAASGEPPHDGFAEDAGIVAAISDDATVKKKAAVIEAEALMSEGEFSAAFRQIIRTYREAPGARRGLGLAARMLLLEAMAKGEDEARLAALDAYFDFQDFILGAEGVDASTPLHLAAVNAALDFQLPNVAEYALRLSGLEGAEANDLSARISRLGDVTAQPINEFAAASRTQEYETASQKPDGQMSTAEAEAAAVRAYLAGEASLPEETRAMLRNGASDLDLLFENDVDARALDADGAKALAAATAVQLRILKEAAHGG